MSRGLDMIGGKTASTAHMRDTTAMTTTATPQVGDIRYNKRTGGGHVGLVVAVNGNKVTTIEGNTGSGEVAYRTHTVGDGGIFRRPAYNGMNSQAVVKVAEQQVGYKEGAGNSTPFGKFTGTNGSAWCASFLSWCFDKAYGGEGYESYGTDGNFAELGGWDAEGNYIGPTTGLGVGIGGLEFHGHIWGNSDLVVYYSRLCNGSYFTRENRASHVTVHNAYTEADIATLASMINSSGKGFNYGVDIFGNIGLFVDEQMWTNSCENWEADSFGINIICSGTEEGGFGTATLTALTDLLEDVFRRNFLYLVTFNDNIDDTLTLHRQYNTSVTCPGPAAEVQLRIIADEVNSRLSAKIQTNFVQVGSRLAASRTLALRTQSLINIRQINPYVITFTTKVKPKDIDIQLLWNYGVIGAFIDIGTYSSKNKFDTDKIYNLCLAMYEDGTSMPFGFIFKSKASSIEDVREEAYWLHFIVSKYPPKFGLWIEPDFPKKKAAALLQAWYEFFVDWGLKSKCGIYADRDEIDNIGWPAQSNYMALWLAGEMTDAVCPDEELLTPTFFKLDDLTNYGINIEEQAYWKSAALGFNVYSDYMSPLSNQSAVYDGELKVVQNGDGTTTVVIPEVTDHNVAKKWESYTAITNQSTINYQLTHSANTTTDELGFRKYDGRYLIAVGSGVCAQTGTYIDVKLKNGKVIPCIMGDGKADIHTDKNNIYTNVNSTYCCSEFIVDRNKLDSKAKKTGNVSCLNGWDSPVVEMKVYNKRVASA